MTEAHLKWPAAKVRQTFVDYFVNEHQHTFIPSSKVVPENDPTLLFTNAGMNQFKPIFLGQADPNTELGKLKRVVNSQKCIRAGGKHNDLDDVGKDTYHHTFFEMLGNWSFGDYFKKEAIFMAWDLLTRVYGMDKDRLYVTYFEGNPKSNPPLPPDLEARDIWKSMGIPDYRILPGNMKDNFWEMGDTGPCGPCSEIHYDRVGGRDASKLVNSDDPMVIEIWNNVFMQFNREKDGSLVLLPAKHVDTGMGFERITSILQGVLSNYDTDIWSDLFKEIQRITGCKQAYDYVGPDKNNDIVVAYRVVADHIRTITTSIVDGANPDNIGRGYVLRRVVRRAIRFGHEYLGAKEGFFQELVEAVARNLGDFFPELKDAKNLKRAKTLILEEEKSFGETYANGMKQFQEFVKTTPKGGKITGDDSFLLHATYGFPVDLTVLMAESQGLKVDVERFNVLMEEHKKKGGAKMKAEGAFLNGFAIDDMRKRNIATTDDNGKYCVEEAVVANVLIVTQGSTLLTKTSEATTGKELISIVLDKTNFYAESGGQLYDIGTLTSGSNVFKVEKVLTFGGYVCHIGSVTSGEFKIGDAVTTSVEIERRNRIAANHTMTHQLNHALRKVLQDGHPDAFTEVNQKGSYVSDEVLRFDFSWNAKLELTDLQATEKELQEAINANLSVYSKEVPLKQAMEIKSLRCMFDEKYGDVVKVVSIGVEIEKILADPANLLLRNYSIELCGGTHLRSLGPVDKVVIVGEDALMKGVRRMTVTTGDIAKKAITTAEDFVAQFKRLSTSDAGGDYDERTKELSVLLKNVNDHPNMSLVTKAQLRVDIDNAIKALLTAKKEFSAQVLKNAEAFSATFAAGIPADAKFVVVEPNESCPPTRDALQAVADGIQKIRKDLPVLVIGLDSRKPTGLVLSLSGNNVLNAVEWVKASTGKGGGKPSAAQGGFATEQAAQVVEKAKAYPGTLSL